MSVTLATAGTPFPGSAFASPIYRIPALTRTGTGRLIVAFDVREDWRDLPADFDLAYMVSDDNGKTWSRPRPLRAHTPGHGFGDASLTYDPSSGIILCWYVGSTGESYFSARPGGPGLELWLATSDDDGQTWSHRDFSFLRPANVGGMFTASGNGAVGHGGLLLQPFVARIDDENWAITARSYDHGDTWSMGEPVGPHCDENKVIALPDDSILMHARSRPHRYWAISTDDAQHFSSPQSDLSLTDPACNGGLCECGGVMLASMCDDPSERTRLGIHVSVDNGRTWSPAIIIDEGACAYSVMTALDDDHVVVVWEADDYLTLQCAIYSLSELGLMRNGDCWSWDSDRVTLSPRGVQEGCAAVAKPPVVNAN
ncbi:sialidase family protein [Actinomyces vulturis]|uniref:sialidase family protein n=1 Tax=Actinomyces vulturis TaxID=1857645 RepID=UPI00082B0F38|nr:sialidase family protein [Actinomyces vulturis]